MSTPAGLGLSQHQLGSAQTLGATASPRSPWELGSPAHHCLDCHHPSGTCEHQLGDRPQPWNCHMLPPPCHFQPAFQTAASHPRCSVLRPRHTPHKPAPAKAPPQQDRPQGAGCSYSGGSPLRRGFESGGDTRGFQKAKWCSQLQRQREDDDEEQALSCAVQLAPSTPGHREDGVALAWTPHTFPML